MNSVQNGQSGDGTQARFPSQTQWTNLIRPAADPSSPEAQEALNHLCQIYWFPLYAFIRSQGVERQQAKDLVQEFFRHLLKNKLIARAKPDKGRFRTFLLGCLQNYLVDEWRRRGAIKRGGGVTLLSIDDSEAEEKFQNLPNIQPAPEATFDRTWAATVMEEALSRLKCHYASLGKASLFETVKGCISGELSPKAYPGLSARLEMSKGAFQVNLSRFKEEFGKQVRSVIGETVDPAEVDDEIKHLLAAWAAYLNENP